MKKIILISAGSLSLFLGVIGIFLPLLPTTPFIILAASCFSGTSPKLYNKLLQSKYLGAFIKNYRNKTPINKIIKLKSIIFLWITLSTTAIIFNSLWILFLLIATAITIHILTLP